MPEPSPTRQSATLKLAATPARDAKAPHKFKASGELVGETTNASTCTGKVTVKAKKGAATKATKTATLRLASGECVYSANFRFAKAPASRLKLSATFPGNDRSSPPPRERSP